MNYLLDTNVCIQFFPYDMQIAAISLAHNFTLVSHNIREFQRIDELLLEDWETD